MMWTVIVKSKRSEWIHWMTIGRTKLAAWTKYLEQWMPEHQQQCQKDRQAGKVRLARVRIAEWANAKPSEAADKA